MGDGELSIPRHGAHIEKAMEDSLCIHYYIHTMSGNLNLFDKKGKHIFILVNSEPLL